MKKFNSKNHCKPYILHLVGLLVLGVIAYIYRLRIVATLIYILLKSL